MSGELGDLDCLRSPCRRCSVGHVLSTRTFDSLLPASSLKLRHPARHSTSIHRDHACIAMHSRLLHVLASLSRQLRNLVARCQVHYTHPSKRLSAPQGILKSFVAVARQRLRSLWLWRPSLRRPTAPLISEFDKSSTTAMQWIASMRPDLAGPRPSTLLPHSARRHRPHAASQPLRKSAFQIFCPTSELRRHLIRRLQAPQCLERTLCVAVTTAQIEVQSPIQVEVAGIQGL
ncbi:hypothetical protein OH76DRAFT_653760 [Lentinus brumalis]|uniref:Uncharacterized protein n=1 Tax=Lentinus brumalis TaxID=2498619 RepID=A0A371D7C3_9APHY|nr:hypothetical protein OH76DRAFT_653760 [Polyporus brumalis]